MYEQMMDQQQVTASSLTHIPTWEITSANKLSYEEVKFWRPRFRCQGIIIEHDYYFTLLKIAHLLSVPGFSLQVQGFPS